MPERRTRVVDAPDGSQWYKDSTGRMRLIRNAPEWVDDGTGRTRLRQTPESIAMNRDADAIEAGTPAPPPEESTLAKWMPAIGGTIGGVVGGIGGMATTAPTVFGVPFGGLGGATVGAGLGGAAGESVRQMMNRWSGADSPDTSEEAAKSIAGEGVFNAGAELVGGLAGRGIARGMRALRPPPVIGTDPVSAIGRKIELPATQGFRRPAEGRLANAWARRQEPRILRNAAAEVNKELRTVGAGEISTAPLRRAQILGETDRSLKSTARAEVQASRGARESALEGRASGLRDAEARVQALLGPSQGTTFKIGEKLRDTMLTNRSTQRKALGDVFDRVIDPIRDEMVDATELVDAVADLAARQGDIPVVQQAQARLREYLPNLGGKPVGTQMTLGNLRQFSEEFGSKIRLSPGRTRAQGPAVPLRQVAEDLVEKRLADLGSDVDAYRAARTTYGKEFAPTFQRGVVPRAVADPQTPEKIVEAAFQARRSPGRARALTQALGKDDASKQALRSAVIEHDLLGAGIEKLPERLSAYDPDVLNIYLGAADRKGLEQIVARVRTLRPNPKTPLANVTQAKERLTSDRLRAITEALRAYERPTSGALPGATALRVGIAGGTGYATGSPAIGLATIVVPELDGLIRTIAAYHPQGGFAKLSRGINAFAAGSPKPLIRVVGQMYTDQMNREQEEEAAQ